MYVCIRINRRSNVGARRYCQLSAKFHYTDRTKSTNLSETRADQQTLSVTRVSDKVWSGLSSGIWTLAEAVK